MSLKKFHIAILASGNGSNADVIIQYFKNHTHISVDLILSNNENAFVLERARKAGIASKSFTRDKFKSPEAFLGLLKEKSITHIVLAGFLWLIPEYLIQAYPNKIINIHPALLPKFGGKGMYGMKVHEAVKQASEVESGITIHLVNQHYDEGKILFQGKCKVENHFSPAEIAECVQKLEHQHYPRVIENWILEAS